ncbi:MAG: DNA polymerase III subunit delta [Gammaproteobacteria bacterium]|nr:DNA polymerase III subunit delta [Gammaproteobacteria bacterium]
MKLAYHQLNAQLSRELKPLYLLAGDEPLQMGEAADLIRGQARRQGFLSRELLDVDNQFDWGRLAESANSLSLFAEQRIIDLRIPSGKPGSDGSKALVNYAKRPAEDALLLITMPKLERAQLSSTWYRSLDNIGISVQIWPVEEQQLPGWIEHRMRHAELKPAPEVIPMLVERCEGNLLAARQEIEKLVLLFGPGRITSEQLLSCVADSARFDVFALVDSALEGRAGRCLRILDGVRAEGIPAPVVLWALARELRLLTTLASEVTPKRPVRQVVAANRAVWEKRKPIVVKGLRRLDTRAWRSLLKRCARIDRAIKGRGQEDPWHLMEDTVLRMAGVELTLPG